MPLFGGLFTFGIVAGGITYAVEYLFPDNPDVQRMSAIAGLIIGLILAVIIARDLRADGYPHNPF